MRFNDEDTTHPETRKAYRVLKARGYRGGGRTAGITRFWDKVFGVQDFCADAHRVYTNRLTGEWESSSLDEFKPSTTGFGADALAQHLATVRYERTPEWSARNTATLNAIKRGFYGKSPNYEPTV